MARAYLNCTVFDPGTGDPLPGTTATVFLRGGTTLATLYSTESGSTVVANPLVTQAGGSLQAWANQGSYDLRISGNGIATFTQPWEAVSGANIINLTQANFNAANIDGTVSTPSLRTLGTGANQAMPGNATPSSGSPSGAAGGGLSGTYPNPTLNIALAHTWTAEQAAPDFKATGLPGASSSARFVGATSGGPPASGTFQFLDFVLDNAGSIWVCVQAGSPGTWQAVGGQPPENVHRIGQSGQPAFLNGWVNTPSVQTAGYLKDPFGIVHLMGTVQSGTLNSAIFTLPAGYRPLSQIKPSNVTILSSGDVLGPNTTSTCLDGITFMEGI